MMRRPDNGKTFRALRAAFALSLGLALAVPAPGQDAAADAAADQARWMARANDRLAALKAAPGNPARMEELGETLLTAGKYAPARKALNGARRGGAPRAALLLAECGLRESGATRAAAEEALSLAASSGTDDPQAALLESLAKELSGDVPGALDAAVRAAELAERTDGIGEERAHRILDQLERCIHLNHVFSLVE